MYRLCSLLRRVKSQGIRRPVDCDVRNRTIAGGMGKLPPPSQQRYKGYSWPLNSNDIYGVVCISVFRKTNRKIVVPAISRDSSILLEK